MASARLAASAGRPRVLGLSGGGAGGRISAIARMLCKTVQSLLSRSCGAANGVLLLGNASRAEERRGVSPLWTSRIEARGPDRRLIAEAQRAPSDIGALSESG